jgi:amidase
MNSDSLGAFCSHVSLNLPGRGDGPLAGLTFAAKDNFAVAGFRSSGGSPDWLRTHGPEPRTAPAVQTILDAGATLTGKTNMDELAFSLDGVNAHFGTPINPAAPDRIPGGSSSGSASAVAGRLVDFALGTDTAGSGRVPGSLCGLFGIRPTHGRIPIDGIVPFAPSFDTVGWLTRSAELLRRVGDVLLGASDQTRTFRRLLIADDFFADADEVVRNALMPHVQTVARAIGRAQSVTFAAGQMETWIACFGTLRGAEVRVSLGDWIAKTEPNFGPGIRERFEHTKTITQEMVEDAAKERRAICQHFDTTLGEDGVLCLPTVPVLPPRRAATAEELATYRGRTLRMTIIATIGGLPQVTLPLGQGEGVPVGLSLIGPRGSDGALLRLAAGVNVSPM